MAEIIAQSGMRYLARIDAEWVRIINTEEKTVGPRITEAQALANGIWEPIPNDSAILEKSRNYQWQKLPENSQNK